MWNYQTTYNSGIWSVIYILLLLQCPSVATLGHFEQLAFLEVMPLLSISRLAKWCFFKHFEVKGLRLGTMFWPFHDFFLFSCFCNAGTFKLAACFKTFFCTWYSPIFCFISRLSKVSLVAVLRNYVSDREKTLFCDAGTLWLSWAPLVHKKLVSRELLIWWWFLASFTIWWMKICIECFNLSIGLLIRVLLRFPSVNPSVAKHQPIHGKTMRTWCPSFGFMLPVMKGEQINIQNMSSV